MESKEILKEFAGKLAGLSAAAKVVALAGAVSAYSGTGYAAEDAVKTKSRFITVVEPKKNDVASDTKKEESVAAKTEEVVAPKVSEAAVKTLSANKEKDVAKAATASKAKIAPSIQEKVNVYEPKKTPTYNTKYYQAPGTAKTSDRASRSSSHSYASSSSYSSYNYNAPKAPSFVAATSDDDAFGENASSSRSTSASSRSSRRSYDWRRTRTNSDGYYGSTSKNIGSKDSGSEEKTSGVKKGSASASSSSQSTGLQSFSGFGGGDSRPSAPKYDAKTQKALEISEEIEQGRKRLVDASKIQQSDSRVKELENELQAVRTEKSELAQQLQAQRAANIAHDPAVGAAAAVAPAAVPVPPPPAPIAPAADLGGVPVPVIEGGAGAGVPPPPPPPPPPPGVIAGGAGVPPPPPPPPPPGVPAAPGAPQAPGAAVPNVNQVDYKSILKTLEKQAKEKEEEARKKLEEQRKKREELDKKEGNIPGVLELYIKEGEANGWDERSIAANARTYESKFNALVRRFRNEKTPYAFYDTIIRVLEDISKEKDANQIRGYGLLMGKCCEDFVTAALYFETFSGLGRGAVRREWEQCKDEENIPDFIPDRYAEGKYFELLVACFEKCGLKSGDIENLLLVRLTDRCLDDVCRMKGTGDGAVRRAAFSEVTDFILSNLFDDPKSPEARKMRRRIEDFEEKLVSTKDKNALAEADRGVVYGREDYINCLKAVLTDPHFKKAAAPADEDEDGSKIKTDAERAIRKILGLDKWYADADAAKKAAEKFKEEFVDEKGKTDLDDPKKTKILEMLVTLANGFMVSKLKQEARPGNLTLNNQRQMADVRTKLIAILKKTKSPQVIAFTDEMRRKWNEKTEALLKIAADNLEDRVAFAQESKEYFNKITVPFRTGYEQNLAKYDQMLIYPVVSKLEKAVTDSGRRLRIEFGDAESDLMRGNTKLVIKVLQSLLKLSKSTTWVFEGKWIGTFLDQLPLRDSCVSNLTLMGASFGNLAVLNTSDDLKTVTFKDVSFHSNALSKLKLNDAELKFIDTKSTDPLYKGEGILKHLADNRVKLTFARSNPWVHDGVRPVAVAADPVNPQQNGGRRGLRGIGGNGNVAVENANGRQQNDPLAGVRLRPRPQDPQGNAPVGERNKNDVLANFINNLKAIDNKQERDSEILQFHQELWEAHADLETVELNVPLATFDMTGSLRDLVKAAVQHANKSNKPLALVGSFNGRHFESIKDITGDVVRGLDGLKMSLQFAFSYEGGYEIEFTRWVLETIDNLKNSADDPVTNPPQSVELDRIIPKGEMLNALARLKLDTVKFSNLDKCGTITKDMQGRITDTRFDAWKKDIDFSEHGWKNLLIKTKTVDFSTNCIRESLDGLKRLLGEMAPGDNAQEGDNPQPPEPVRLEEIILPEDMNAADVTAIKALVEGLKSGQH